MNIVKKHVDMEKRLRQGFKGIYDKADNYKVTDKEAIVPYNGEDMVGMNDFDMLKQDYDILKELVVWLFNNVPIEFQLSYGPDKYFSNAYTKGTLDIQDIIKYINLCKNGNTIKKKGRKNRKENI